MVRKRPPDKGPVTPLEKPSGPTKLQYQNHRRILWPLIFVLNSGSVGMWWLGSGAFWIWHHRWKTAKGLAVLFWRGIALLSVGYLVYDRIYEADATLSAPASDPKFLFEFPFAITNNSHVFAIRNVRWSCEPIEIRWPVNNVLSGGRLISGSSVAIEPGQILNFDCSFIGPNSHVLNMTKVTVEKAALKISLEYDADLFGLLSLHRRPAPTLFIWFAGAANPQWIKGNSVR